MNKKGILEKVSKFKGLKLKDSEEWINIHNSIKESLSIDYLKSLIDFEVELNIEDKYYNRINAIKKNNLQIHTIISSESKEFDSKVNNYMRRHNVKYVQTHFENPYFVAVIYYEE